MLELLIGFLYPYAMRESLEDLTKSQLLALLHKEENRLAKAEKILAQKNKSISKRSLILNFNWLNINVWFLVKKESVLKQQMKIS